MHCIVILVTVLGGFANNLGSLCFMRGLRGIGGGLIIPNIVASLGFTLPPGKYHRRVRYLKCVVYTTHSSR
ncbi:hypothetical protein F9C07_2131138 [Aspergillus flavus]|uniref:Major facilitator superfamily (MFS) profile domain-containing protein n=1 Tax=Aspergillus flavus (strain ATCC 200026 / FGSC A1120 / IAM 13836 / NRRL 3357 / JCM 12722 / SRRC 167) TaxID=332952 RepID=A0A7U2MFF2_ASPFN|nr:hypothetical protein F9C07_2131138 [Aspergillus flavus]